MLGMCVPRGVLADGWRRICDRKFFGSVEKRWKLLDGRVPGSHFFFSCLRCSAVKVLLASQAAACLERKERPMAL